jgi:hyperosmotically inducible periplasmic protein
LVPVGICSLADRHPRGTTVFSALNNKEISMKQKLATTLMIIGVLLGPVVAIAAEDTDADRSHPKAFVKDSAITTKIKAKLAAEHITSLGNIHVDTDANGVVWLHGTAHTQEAADKAVSIARETEGVKAVKSRIKVKKDD